MDTGNKLQCQETETEELIGVEKGQVIETYLKEVSNQHLQHPKDKATK
jgi:hypothetical protein